MTDILSIIYEINKNYFKDDKMLIILFDDIALINGYIFKSLPQRWTIIRRKFDMAKQIKDNNFEITNVLKNDNQMHLNFEK